VTELGQQIDARTPVSVGRPSPLHLMSRDGGDYEAGARVLGRSRYSDDVIVLGTHTGTHVDALAHVWYDEQLYNGHPQSSLRSNGAARCGIDKLGPIVGRGVLLDVAAHCGREALAPAHPIHGAGLRACAAEQSTEVRAADIVLVRTGWWGARGEDERRYFEPEPGIDLDAARWLASMDVAAVGSDNYAVEALGGDVAGFPVHELLLRDCGIPLIEGLVLDQLAAQGVHEFLFVASPLALRGATASPLTPLAVH
jgi:kynurenine formamidase